MRDSGNREINIGKKERFKKSQDAGGQVYEKVLNTQPPKCNLKLQ